MGEAHNWGERVGKLEIRGLAYHGMGPIDLVVEQGQCASLCGVSGAGKSLLLRAIADLDPHAGEIWLDGVESQQMRAPAWRRRVGLLPPDSPWWRDTVGEHFTAVDESALTALGFTIEVLSWQVSRLSSGERQRLALLRLLVREPSALLLDEPTANLDTQSTGRVEAFVARYREQRRAPVIWVSHDPGQRQRVASRHLRIANGRLTEDASCMSSP